MKVKQLPTYQDIIKILACNNRKIFPAELHGYICGLICGGGHTEDKMGFEVALNMLADEGYASKSAKEVVARLMIISFQQLQDVDCGFQLLLPEDNETLLLRTEALVGWCQNFLSGLGVASVDQQIFKNPEFSETLRDISEITKLKHDKKTPEEEAEAFYMELVEYVRMATLLIYTENVSRNTNKQPKETVH
jgi:uncharacterized protein